MLPGEWTTNPLRHTVLLSQRHRRGVQLPGAGGLYLPVELKAGRKLNKSTRNEENVRIEG